MAHDVISVGAPLMDHIHFVSEEQLSFFTTDKGGMQTIDEEQLKKILYDPNFFSTQTSGGSAANVLKGLANLGENCLFIGKIGKDSAGRLYEKKLQEIGINTHLKTGNRMTGHALSFVTPDGERSMRTYLGASQELSVKDIPLEELQTAKLVHFEAYTLFCPGVLENIMSQVKGVVSLDLSSYEVVEKFRPEIIKLICAHVDILFANEKESFALTGLKPEFACQVMQDLAPLAIVMVGTEGSWVGSEGKIYPFPAYETAAKDTTGAGDVFESGFLHGYLHGKSLAESVHLGATAAHNVVQVLGAELSAETWRKIRTRSGEPLHSP